MYVLSLFFPSEYTYRKIEYVIDTTKLTTYKKQNSLGY
jgi:hypothetical protein